MASYEISWQGSLVDLTKQKELIERVRKVGEIYNDIYFEHEKDETTLIFYDHATIQDEVLISGSMFNIPEDASNEDIFQLKRYSKSQFACNNVKLFGVQFLIKGDSMYTRKNKNCLETVSYVFWGFNSTTEENSFVKSNLARLSLKKLSENNTQYEITSPFVSSRNLQLWFVIYLYEFVKHYYIKDLVIENTMFWDDDYQSDFKKYLIENDPNGSNPDINEKAFEMILKEVEFIGPIARKMDDDDIEHDENLASSNEENFMLES